jgi:Dolichyl-phosphate-mannose-protein mannosyltransferase
MRTVAFGTVASAMVRRLRTSPKTPLVLLAVVSVLSLAARAALLGEPCQSPCTQASQHTLIFDEAYYVNAARVIAGIHPLAGSHYADSPLGTDPNAEHPQLAKLIMAGAIELFGDGPFAWRIGSLIFGSLTILGMYALVRAAGGGPWSALCASTIMACDNLLLVHGRIGTLDIYAVAAMIWGVAIYLRGRPVLAGTVLAVGAAFKLVAPYAVAVLALLELGRVVACWRWREGPEQWRPSPALKRFAITTFTGVGVFLGILAVMGQIATPYNDATAQLITGGPFAHLSHMISYAAQQTSPDGPKGIASYPWNWLIDGKAITYLRINPSLPGHGLFAIHPVSKFLGLISPPVLAGGMIGLLFALFRLVRPAPLAAGGPRRWASEQPLVAVTWFVGTWTPFALLSLVDQRTSYLYYMVVVMPGLYLAAAYLASQLWRLRRRWLDGLVILWALGVFVTAVLLYPFIPLF